MIDKIKTVVKNSVTAINAFINEHRNALTGFCTVIFMLSGAAAAQAITAPSGGFAQDIYDIGVTQIMGGPIGFTIGAGCMALGGFAAVKQQIPMAVGSVLGGAAIMKCDSLVTSLGMLLG